jgi:membrane-associated phospholipid phosphatase
LKSAERGIFLHLKMNFTNVVQYLPILYLVIHSALILHGRLDWKKKLLIILVNVLFSTYFAGLVFGSDFLMGNNLPGMTTLFLWSPIVFFWTAYLWAGKTMESIHPPGFGLDSQLIRLESKWFRQPSLWWARGRSRWLTELMQFFYFSYFFYTLGLGIYLQLSERVLDFQSMTFAVSFGYLVAFSFFALTPATGPRWALVESGLLSPAEQRQKGYALTWLTEKIMYDGPAHRGGAMPSAHSSTAVVFVYWCWQIWGPVGGIPALVLGTGMALGAVYGRYHYLTDVLIGSVLGVLALLLAEMII